MANNSFGINLKVKADNTIFLTDYPDDLLSPRAERSEEDNSVEIRSACV